MKYTGMVSFAAAGVAVTLGVVDAETPEALREAIKPLMKTATEAVKKETAAVQKSSGKTNAPISGPAGGFPQPAGDVPICPLCNSSIGVSWIRGNRQNDGKAYGFYKCVNCDAPVRTGKGKD